MVLPAPIMSLLSWVENTYGLDFRDRTASRLENLIVRRVNIVGLETVEDYSALLVRDKTEQLRFIDLLTVNETYFFRDIEQLNALKELLVPTHSHRGVRNLRIWSAGCSIGCEPYTMALLLKEWSNDGIRVSAEIIGTDISQSCISVARSGLYTEREIKPVPSNLREQYFTWDGRYYAISSEVKRVVNFRLSNLLNADEIQASGKFDVVLCRNVLMYFSDEARARALRALFESLYPGGAIVVSRVETKLVHELPLRKLKFGTELLYVR